MLIFVFKNFAMPYNSLLLSVNRHLNHSLLCRRKEVAHFLPLSLPVLYGVIHGENGKYDDSDRRFEWKEGEGAGR